MYFTRAGGQVPVSLYIWIHPRVCARTRARNQARGRGGQISRGLRGSECMLGAGLCSLCSLCDSWERGRKAREVEEQEGRGEWRDVEKAARADPVEKNSTGGGRECTTSCKGTALKREVVNPVWASYPTLRCVPSFGKGLSPRSRVFVCVCGVGIKMIDWSLGGGAGWVVEGFRQSGPSSISQSHEWIQ